MTDRYARQEYFCIYTRVSSKSQDDNTSDEGQYRKCKEFGESQGWTFLEDSWIHDTHTGKEFKKRKNVNKVIELLEEGKVKYVVWYKVDRASRDQSVLREFIEEIYEAKGKIAIQQKGVTYPTKRKAIEGTKVDGFLSEWEKDSIVGKFDDGKLEQFFKGSVIYGLPFGYRSVEVKRNGKRFKEAHVDEVHRDNIVSFLGEFARVRNQAQAVKFAREQGYLTDSGQPYNHNTLRFLLDKLDIYAEIPQKQWFNKDMEYSREFTYPRIISDDLYKRVKEAKQLKTKSPVTANKPFAELVFCSHCGSPAKVFPWSLPKKKDGSRASTFVYGCKKYNKQKRMDYINFGKHVTQECRRTVVFSFIKEVITGFLDSAATYAAADKYAEEVTTIILNTRNLYREIEGLREGRKAVIGEIDKLHKRIDRAFDLDDDSGSLAQTIRGYQERVKVQQDKLDGINIDIQDKTEDYEKVIGVLTDMGVSDIGEKLFSILDSKVVTLNTLGFSEALAAIEATSEEAYTLTSNLLLPDIVRRQTEVMKGNIQRLRGEIEAENWEEVNSLMYRLGLRIYVNFNDISKKGGRDKPRAEVRATLEGLGVSGFSELPSATDYRTPPSCSTACSAPGAFRSPPFRCPCAPS